MNGRVASVEELAGTIPPGGRKLVAIGGPPGAGKTTLAMRLATILSERKRQSVAVQMDGWHLSNGELASRGLQARKGAPDTFDVPGLLNAIFRLKEMPDSRVYLPAYSRTVHEPIAASVLVDPSVEVIIFEGNYLLLGKPPWTEVRSQFDVTVCCSTRWHVCRERLVERQMESGKSLTDAVEWVDHVDRMNFDTVKHQSHTDDSLLYEGPELRTLPCE